MSHIEVGNGPMTFVGRPAVDIYRLMVMRSAVRLESKGMKMSRGKCWTTIARKELGLRPRAPHALVIEAIEKRLVFLKNAVPVVKRESEGNPAAPTVDFSGPTETMTE